MLIIDKLIRCNGDDSKQNGSVLILMVIIIAIIASISSVALNIVISQYQIKKSNSDIRRSLYLSEDGINSSTLKVYDLIYEACSDSLNKADEYMELYPEDIDGAKVLFKNNYKLYVINKAANKINSKRNPFVQILNYNNLFFVNEKLTLVVKSKHISDTGIEKSLTAELIILIPNYIDIKTGTLNHTELFFLSDFEV